MAYTVDQLIDAGEDIPVLAAQEAEIWQDDTLIGFATNVRVNQDLGLNPIKTLGQLGPRGFKNMDYNCRISIDSFMVMKGIDIDGVLQTPNRASMSKAKFVNFKLRNSVGNNDLYLIRGCKCATVDLSFQEGQLVTKATEWLGMEVKSLGTLGDSLGE